MAILRRAEGGVPVAELCREHGMSNASFYKWRAKYGGMDASLISKVKAMEEENRRLKRVYAELSMHPDVAVKVLGSMRILWQSASLPSLQKLRARLELVLACRQGLAQDLG